MDDVMEECGASESNNPSMDSEDSEKRVQSGIPTHTLDNVLYVLVQQASGLPLIEGRNPFSFVTIDNGQVCHFKLLSEFPPL